MRYMPKIAKGCEYCNTTFYGVILLARFDIASFSAFVFSSCCRNPEWSKTNIAKRTFKPTHDNFQKML